MPPKPKKIKPPSSTDPKPKKPKPKPQKSLTNAEYDEIFDAVINEEGSPQHYLLNFKSPLIGKSPQLDDAFSPKECASLENSQNTSSQKQEKIKITPIAKNTQCELVVSLNKPQQIHSESSNNQSESISTIHSEEFRKNAANSTPVIDEPSTKKKQKSFREAVKNLKDTESQLNETLLGSLSQAQTSLNNSLMVDTPLSQPPANLNHRERLLWLQARRGENVFVQCDKCDKWRLSDVQDPVDLPDKWYCHMSKDLNLNKCSIPEQKLSMYVEADLIVNQYTAGSLVWAKIYSYPWWPAMVDDDPDTEQYYWIEDYDLNIPTSYNVTFFEGKNGSVTRAWIAAKNLKSFKHNLNLDKNVSTKYKARLGRGKQEALEAMELPIKERLIKYSFISKTNKRINTPVSTPVHSASEDEMNVPRNSVNKINKRRYTVDNPVAQKSKKGLEMTKSVDKTQQPATVVKKVTKRRNTTVAAVNEQLQIKKDESEKTLNVQNENKVDKIQRRRKSIPAKDSQRDSSQDTNEPKKVTRRRNTRADTSIETDRSLSQGSAKEKKITKRRKTISEYKPQTPTKSPNPTVVQDPNKLEKSLNDNHIPRRRYSIPKRSPQRDSSQDTNEPKKVTRRRNTRADTSIETDRSLSQGSAKEKKITKRRKTIAEPQISTKSHKSTVDQDPNKLEKSLNVNPIQRRRNSISGKSPQRDSSQDTKEPKKVTRRRNTRADTSIETDRSVSQESAKREKRTDRTTICENERSFQRNSSQDSSFSKNNRSKSTCDTSVERESSFSEDSKKRHRISRRRTTIGKHELQNSGGSQKKTDDLNGSSKLGNEKEVKIERDSDVSEKVSKLSEHGSQNSQKTIKESNSQRSQIIESNPQSDKENKIRRRRNTVHEKDSQRNNTQSSDTTPKITKRRNTLANTANTAIERENSFSQEESRKITKRRSTRLDSGIEKDNSSQNSEESRKITKRRTTRLDSSIEKDNTSSQDSKKENKITKRRKTIAEYNYQIAEESENTNIRKSPGNKISRRRNTIDKDSSLTDSSIRSDSSSNLNKGRSSFICPTQNVKEASGKLDNNIAEQKIYESQSEPKKIRKTLGARKIVATTKLKNSKEIESGYESAISLKKGKNKQNLSAISEESFSKLDISETRYSIPKKQRLTSDEQEKNIGEKKTNDNDEELEMTFTSLSKSLEQLDAEKRKKKFMAICEEIVNIDKDSEDPTISEQEKLFYEKLNSSLQEAKEKQDNLNDDKLMKKVEGSGDKLHEVESKEKNVPKNKNTTSTITSANTSMNSDFSDNDNTAKKLTTKKSLSDECLIKKKTTSKSSLKMYDFKEDF